MGTMPALLLALALAPVVSREPVGQGGWQQERDPVARRVASVMAGEPLRAGVVTIVPLFARVPSEAAAGEAGSWVPRAPDGTLGARGVQEGARVYLRLVNPNPHPVFVPAGTCLRRAGRELLVAHDAVIPADFAALLPAYAPQAPGTDDEAGELEPAGSAFPLLTGALLLGDPATEASVHNTLAALGGPERLLYARSRAPVRAAWRRATQACAPLPGMLGGTAVGAVFLIGNRPASAHVFAGHDLFVAALPRLLEGVAVQARLAEAFQGGEAVLERFARSGDARGRALAFLRRSLGVPGEWSESYGAGFEVIFRNERDGVIGHAIADHRHRVVHAAYFFLGDWWPGRKRRDGAGRPGGPGPGPPNRGGNENAPGEIDRRPRPSLADARQRPRRPGPPPPRPR